MNSFQFLVPWSQLEAGGQRECSCYSKVNRCVSDFCPMTLSSGLEVRYKDMSVQ